MLLLSGCDLAPIYRPEHFVLPGSYHGSALFHVTHPEEAAAHGDWWRLFGDPLLRQRPRSC